MAESAQIDFVQSDLESHPSFAIWQGLRPSCRVPQRIAVLKPKRRKSAVYRLEGVGPSGSAVIAKRCRMATAKVERCIYEDILPHIPVPSLRLYGFHDEPGTQFSWLFLEDAGEVRFSTEQATHRALASVWLGTLHALSERLEATCTLPPKGPAYYLDVLRSARNEISEHLTNPSLQTDHVALLTQIVAQCDNVESCWDQVQEFCAGCPKTLVHSDFVHKNVRVRRGSDGLSLLPFDWESAGYGVPAPDLEGVDIPTYHEVVGSKWQHINLADTHRLAHFGRIFRLLAEISWASESLPYSSEKVIRDKMYFYHSWLSDAIATVGWEE